MQLRDRGLLSLDDKVTTWIPELRQMHDAFGSMDDITIRMLLSHSAGFQNPTWPYKAGKPWEPFEPTRWEQLVAMMPYQEIHFAPGSQYGYSNPAFIYLARILELVTGDPYQSYIQKNIWTPLGMTWSYFGATPFHLARHRSNNYTVRRDSSGREVVTPNGRDFDPGITIPNGGWNAPLGDVATWIAFLAGAPPSDTAKALCYDGILERHSLEEMWRPVVSVDDSTDMGLSFFLQRTSGGTLVMHSGDQAGFHSQFALNPTNRTAVIFVFNTSNADENRAPPPSYGRMMDAMAAMIVAR
jgi:CubicO group peptidase (beta-lactamase class C family)